MKELPIRVDSAAGRLRLAQADLAEKKAETRRAYFDEIIEKELAGLTAEERGPFLDALADQFPVPNREAAETPPAPAANDLAEQIRSRSPEQQQEILRLLGREPAAEQAGMPPELERSARDLMKRLGLKQIELPRMGELLDSMASFAGALEQIAWSTWRTLAPDSPLKRTAELAGTMKSFLSGDENVSLATVRQALDTLRKLLAALTASLGHVTHHLAYEHFARIAPAEIENLVGVEGGRFLTSRDVKCWRKYVELSGAFDEARLEQDIQGRMARYVESLMKVAGR